MISLSLKDMMHKIQDFVELWIVYYLNMPI